MFGSARSPNPRKPRDRKDDPPPNPDDRYAPTEAVRLDMVDVEGNPVCVLLTPRAAKRLADELLYRLYPDYLTGERR